MPNKEYGYYESLSYRVELTHDSRDNVWFVRYPDLPGCKAHGATQAEALSAGEEMKALWIQTALERGSAVPEPLPESTFSGRFVVRLPRTLHERAAHAADVDGVSLNTYVLEAVAEAVERSGQEHLIGKFVESIKEVLPQAVAFAWHLPDTKHREQEHETVDDSPPMLISAEEEQD